MIKEKNLDEIFPGKVKDIWKNAKPKQKEKLIHQYLALRKGKGNNPEYAKRVARELADNKFYEEHVELINRRLSNYEKVDYNGEDKQVLIYNQGEKPSLTSDYDLDSFYAFKKRKIGISLDNWMRKTFKDYDFIADKAFKQKEEAKEESGLEKITESVPEKEEVSVNSLIDANPINKGDYRCFLRESFWMNLDHKFFQEITPYKIKSSSKFKEVFCDRPLKVIDYLFSGVKSKVYMKNIDKINLVSEKGRKYLEQINKFSKEIQETLQDEEKEIESESEKINQIQEISPSQLVLMKKKFNSQNERMSFLKKKEKELRKYAERIENKLNTLELAKTDYKNYIFLKKKFIA